MHDEVAAPSESNEPPMTDISAISDLAEWTPWLPLTTETVNHAPTTAGVYLVKDVTRLLYVGSAGERSGKGLQGRLRKYTSGNAPHSGLGYHALERALNDPAWLRARLDDLEAGHLQEVRAWSRLSLTQPANFDVSWATAATEAQARILEHDALARLRGLSLWNRRY